MSDFLPAKSSPPGPRPDYQLAGPMDEDPGPLTSFSPKKFFTFLLRYWWVPALTLTLTVAAAISYIVLWAPPTFVSSGRMWETVKLRLPEGDLFSEDLQNFLGTQAELLKSARLQRLAFETLGAASTNAIPLDKDGRPLQVEIKVAQAPKSTVFNLQASSSDPAYTQAYLDALMNQYLEYKKSIRKVVSGGTLASISEQVLRLERDLKTSQDALTSFQQTNNLAVLEEEGKVAGSYLARLKTQLSDVGLERKLLEATALELAGAGRGTNRAGVDPLDAMRPIATSLSQAAPSQRLTAYQELELLKIQREKLSRFMRPKHPRIVKLDAEIEKARKLIDIYQNQSRDQLAASQNALQAKTESVLASIVEWEGKVIQASARIAEAERLRLDVTRSQSLYDRLLTLLQNVDISRSIDQETLAILEPASPAVRSYKLELMVLALAIMGGLTVGLGIVLLTEVRDDRLNSIVEVTAEFGDGVVGQVPELPGRRGNHSLPLLQDLDERHMYVESYRSLRSAILFLPVEGERPKTMLVTSAVPNEGKSTITANLARTMALGGSRVLLVDGDLRRGSLHRLFGVPQGPGLADVLSNGGDLGKAVVPISLNSRHAGPLPTDQGPRTPDPQPSTLNPTVSETLVLQPPTLKQGGSLHLLPRGGHVDNPGDLFLGPAFDELLRRLRQQFDYVLIDSTPIFAADDATTLAPKVDGTLLVLRRRFSRARPVHEAIELLCHRQARVLGLIFNRADASARSYYYYKHAEYYPSARSRKSEVGSQRSEVRSQ